MIITGAILLIQILGVPVIRQIDDGLLDLKFRLRGPVRPDSPISLVAIDQKSLQDVGKWPWPRGKIAALIREVKSRGARAIGLDFIFSEPSSHPKSDVELADAVREAGNVVLGALFYISPAEGGFQTQGEYERNLDLLENARVNIIRSIDGSERKPRLLTAYGALANIKALSGAVREQGFYNVIPESDGGIRYGLLVVRAGEKLYRSLAVSLAKVWYGADNVELITEGGYILKFVLHGPHGSGWRIPADRLGRISINYYGCGGQFPTYRASMLLAGEGGEDIFRDRIVIIGGTSLGDFDMAVTPFNPSMPGIEVQATILDNIIGKRALVSGYPALLFNHLAVIFPGLLMSLVIPRVKRIISGVLILCGILISFLFLDLILFSGYLLNIEAVCPLAAIICTYLGITICGYAMLNKEIRRFNKALSGVEATVSARLDIERFLPEILKLIVKHVKPARGLIAVSMTGKLKTPDDLRDKTFNGFHGLDHRAVLGERFSYERDMISETLKRKKPGLVKKAGRNRRYRRSETGYEPFSLICIPFVIGGSAIGFLYVDSAGVGNKFGRSEFKMLTSLVPSITVAIENAWLYSELKKEREHLHDEVLYLRKEISRDLRFKEIVGSSPEIGAVFNLIEKASSSPISVLIEGETGTGKELVASTIHHTGNRKEGLFVTQSCAALPEHLLESELFGHKKGAFTGAVSDKKGLFEIADGGTMFLDEIRDAPPSVQAKLLRVLQNGIIRPLGSLSERKVDVRIISATNKNLGEEVKKGNFREDLYYRLNAFQIKIPPLRKRIEDIPLLADFFLDKYSKGMQRNIKGFSSEAMALFCAYDYPGNIRELENEVQRSVAMTPAGEVIGFRALSEKFREPAGGIEPVAGPLKEGRPLRERLELIERLFILRVLNKHNNVKTLAAEELGVSRTGLRIMLKRLGIK